MITYDSTADAIYIYLTDAGPEGRAARTVPIDDARMVDYDAAGIVLGVELLGVSHGVDLEGLPEKESAMAFIAGLKKLIKNIGLESEKLTDFGIQCDDLKTFTENSFYAMGSLFNITPVKLTKDDVLAIYENAYE